MNQYIADNQDDFSKTIAFFNNDIKSLRTGRANPNLLDGVLVDSYGTKTPINGVASISVPDAMCILLTPWDKSVLKEIEKAVVKADLGVSVVNEGDKIRLTMPRMTEENRKDLVKKLNEKHEVARVSVRQTRDEIKQAIEQAEKDKDISEDDKFRFMKELDEVVAAQNEELKSIRDKKERDVMTI